MIVVERGVSRLRQVFSIFIKSQVGLHLRTGLDLSGITECNAVAVNISIWPAVRKGCAGKSGPPVASWRFSPNRRAKWNMIPDAQSRFGCLIPAIHRDNLCITK
jgi:hypothetical protein